MSVNSRHFERVARAEFGAWSSVVSPNFNALGTDVRLIQQIGNRNELGHLQPADIIVDIKPAGEEVKPFLTMQEEPLLALYMGLKAYFEPEDTKREPATERHAADLKDLADKLLTKIPTHLPPPQVTVSGGSTPPVVPHGTEALE